MAEKTKDTTDDTAIKTLQDAGFGPMAWLGTAAIEAMSEMTSEVTSFIADRISEDVKTQHALLHCESLTELQQKQMEFMERAYVQYTVETGKLLEMSTSLFPSSKVKSTPL